MIKFAKIGVAGAAITGIALVQPAVAQNGNHTKNLRTITTAVPFLMIAPDSRAGGMGDAGVSTSPDANSMHWNPSKMAFAENDLAVSISYIPWLRRLNINDMNLSYLSAYKKIDDQQAIGASLFYSSLGNITFTNDVGDVIGEYRPNEFAFNVAYARKLSDYFSGGMGIRYIYSNLTMGQVVDGSQTKPGQSVAADVSAYYTNPDITIGKTDAEISAGVNISNIGAKMSYSNSSRKDFIPTNLRLGPTLTLKPDDYNTISFTLEANKLLVPSPPIYSDTNRDSILEGSDPNVGVVSGIFGSFSDAPGVLKEDGSRSVFKEELREVNPSIGIEYWYDNQFGIRTGYFYEHPTKGNRQYFTLGASLRYSVFGFDMAYLIAAQNTNPLANTLRFTLTFDFEPAKGTSN